MENLGEDRLPEANSLPDGFVESPADPLAPATPSNGIEKLSQTCKESRLLKQDCLNDFNNEEEGEGAPNGGREDETNREEPFAAPLVEKKGHSSFEELVEVSKEGCLEQGRDASVKHELIESSPGGSMGSHLKSIPTDEKEKKLSETKATSTGAQEDHVKEASSSSDHLKNNKELPEAKCKSSKRAFRTEKEVLEFTLKYQLVVAERDAAISVRDKLESLCRELQRQNKILMDECKRVSEEGQNLRLDLSTRFHDAIKDVSNKLDEQKGESLSQLKENEMLRDKLKQLADQYTLTEQQHAQQLKQKTLELKIAELKLQQYEEKLVHEQGQMKLYAEQVSQLLATEKNLRLQLTADGEKFQQFQDALQKSNDVFETFKLEIEKMAKSIKELRKENAFLKSKCDKSDYTLIELVEERERLKKQLEKTKNQKEKLESLCRKLQAERKQSSDDNKKASEDFATQASETQSSDDKQTYKDVVCQASENHE